MFLTPETANATSVDFCRSTGNGATEEPLATKNGLREASDIRLEPVFAKRMYADFRAGYDAMYVAYQVTNLSTASDKSDVWLELSGWEGSPDIKPVPGTQLVHHVGSLERATRSGSTTTYKPKTVYALVYARDYTEDRQSHTVKVWEGGMASTPKINCRSDIKGVERSISARANKVNAIRVTQQPTLGGQMVIAVDGVTGKIGSGNSLVDGDAMTLSPTNSSAWPVHALKLKDVKVRFDGAVSNPTRRETCATNNGGTSASQSSGDRWFEIPGRLIVRALAPGGANNCTLPGTTYTATYTFDVTGVLGSSPPIVPVSDIASGNKMKYTGGYPSENDTDTIDFTAAVPQSVQDVELNKKFIELGSVTGGRVDATYELTAKKKSGTSSGDVSVSEIRDTLPTGATTVTLVSSPGGTTTERLSETQSSGPDVESVRFIGPFTVPNSPASSVVIRYTVSLPVAVGDLQYVNRAFAYIDSYAISSGTNQVTVTGTADSDGGDIVISGVASEESRAGAPQVISFTTESGLAPGTEVDLNATSTSGLPVQFSVAPGSTCSVINFGGSWILVMGETDCVVTATQPGDDYFGAAVPVTRTIKALPGQTITFTGVAPFSFSLTGLNTSGTFNVRSDKPGLPVRVDEVSGDCELSTPSSSPTVDGIVITTLTVTAKVADGGCILVASQPGSETVAPASDVTRTVVIGTKRQEITFSTLTPTGGSAISVTNGQSVSVDTDDVSVVTFSKEPDSGGTVGAKTGLPVYLTSLSPSVCQVVPPGIDTSGEAKSEYDASTKNTTTKVARVAAGDCVLQANQDGYDAAGDAKFPPAEPATYTFTFIATGVLAQDIDFTAPSSIIDAGMTATYGDTVTITARSKDGSTGLKTGLRVVFTPNDSCLVGPTTVTSAGDTLADVQFVNVGSCVITATQPGSDDYVLFPNTQSVPPQSAPAITITVQKRLLGVAGLTPPTRPYDGTNSATVSGTPALSNLAVIVGRTQDVSLIVSASEWKFPTINVGNTLDVTNDSVEIVGADAAKYRLPEVLNSAGEQVPGLLVGGGQIIPREITVRPRNETIPSNQNSLECAIEQGALVEGDTFALGADFDCTYRPTTDTTGAGVLFAALTRDVGDYDICLESCTASDVPNIDIERGGVSVKANYAITKNTALLTILSSEDFVDFDINSLSKIEIIYGQEVSEDVLDTPNLVGVSKGNSGVRYLIGSDEKDRDWFNSRGVGTYSLTVAWDEDGGSKKARGTRTFVVKPRPVTFSVAIATKVYDGSRFVPVSVGNLITGTPETGTGLLAADVGELDVSDAPSNVQLASANVTTEDVVFSNNWGNFDLNGDKASNYVLQVPPLTARILPRPIALQVTTHARLIGQANPAFNLLDVSSGTGTGLVGQEDLTDAIEPNPAFDIDGLDPTAEEVGAYSIVPTVQARGNYRLDPAPSTGTLYLADIRFPNAEDNLVTERLAVCECEGFLPGSKATLTIFSTPTELASVTILDDGTCPQLSVPIPAEVEDGDHTLELSAVFPNSQNGQSSVPVRLTPPGSTDEEDGSRGIFDDSDDTPVNDAPIGSQPPTGPTSPPPGRTTPTTQTPTTPPAPVLPPASPNVTTPFLPLPGPPPGATNGLPPAQTTPPTGPQSGPQGTTGPNGQTNGPGVSPLQSVVQRSTDTINTFDLGVEDLSPSQVAGNGNSVKAGTRSVSEMREERLGGFDPSTALQVEVIGSRTTARFVVSTLTGLDELVLIEQITRSSEGNRADFAGVDRVGIGSPTGPQNSWVGNERQSASDIFSYSRLDAPTKQSDLLGSSSYTWLNVEKGVRGYLPGSTIYLTATSSPVVFGEAQVGMDGEAVVNGDLAVELLGLGEHRIRVVGTRVFTDIQVDADGEVIIPDFVLEQILLFDMGTDATVIVTGNNPAGGVHTVMRVVPLDPVSPWWTLWVIAWTALLLLLARMRGMIRTFMEKSVAGGAVLVSSIPALYLGWTSTVTQVAWWGLLMGLGLSLAVWLMPSLRRQNESLAP